MTPEMEMLWGAYRDRVLREREAEAALNEANAALEAADRASQLAHDEWQESQRLRAEARRALEAAIK